MKVGFIITSHWSDKIRPDGNKFLSKIIDSIMKECKHKFKIYIIDNQSEYILSFPDDRRIDYRRIDDQYEKGLTGAWNLGINAAYEDGCDILINCNDDLWFNETINLAIREISIFNDLENVVFGPVTNGVLGKGPQKIFDVTVKIQKLTNDVINGFCFAMHRNHYKKFRHNNTEYFNENNVHNGGDGKWGGQEGQWIENKKDGLYCIILNQWFVPHIKLRNWKVAKKQDGK